MKYEVHGRGTGLSSPAWDSASAMFQWAVFGPYPPFAFGHTVALFLTEDDAQMFADAANANEPDGEPMTNRIYKDDAEALMDLHGRIAGVVLADLVANGIESPPETKAMLTAIEHAIVALRSAQDVERRIVEARIAGMEEATDLIDFRCPCRGYSYREIDDTAVGKRISELRASLERKDGP